MVQSEGNKFQQTKLEYSNAGILYIHNLDENNQELRVKLLVSGVLTDRKVDTSAIE